MNPMLRLHYDGTLVGIETEPGLISWFQPEDWWAVFCQTRLDHPSAEAALAMVRWFYARGWTLADVLGDPEKMAAYNAATWSPITVSA